MAPRQILCVTLATNEESFKVNVRGLKLHLRHVKLGSVGPGFREVYWVYWVYWALWVGLIKEVNGWINVATPPVLGH